MNFHVLSTQEEPCECSAAKPSTEKPAEPSAPAPPAKNAAQTGSRKDVTTTTATAATAAAADVAADPKSLLLQRSGLCNDDSPECLCTRGCFPLGVASTSPCNCDKGIATGGLVTGGNVPGKATLVR